MTTRVGIQGGVASFHHLAAEQYFGAKVEILPFTSFEKLFRETPEEDFIVMAIENSLVGSIMDNYRLMLNSPRKIVGEIFERIDQNLMALPGTRINDLQEVHSHPMAIAQCRPFFEKYPHIALVESEDTALSAEKIQKQQDPACGAIASSMAAKQYGLEIVAPGIETNKENYTRFLVLENSEKEQSGNKVSVSFTLMDEPGGLLRVLQAIYTAGYNLSKIQSLPIQGERWKYRFFVDFSSSFSLSTGRITEQFTPLTRDLSVLGIYREGQQSEIR